MHRPGTIHEAVDMNPTWQSFLEADGAVPEGGVAAHFGDPAAERRAAAAGDVLVDLSHRALIRARGADTQTFLQGQLSNDIKLLDASHSQLSSYSTPKGRMLAILRIIRQADGYLLQLPALLRDDILKRLRMFVLRSKVSIEPADELVALGVSGPRAAALVAEATGIAPAADANGCATRETVSVLTLSGPLPRFEIVAPLEQARGYWEALKVEARRCGPAVWAWLDIIAGIPTVLPATREAFVPQMANLDLVGGVNFKKGCYPGQEIVARVQYLGQLKSRMYRLHVDGTSSPPGAGEALYSADFGEQAAGTVVDAQPSPEGGCDLLAVLQIAAAKRGELHFGSPTGPYARLQSLPYSLPDPG
jgi:folate-binding protein YgfZ